MDIQTMVSLAHENSANHGFWEGYEEKDFGNKIMLMVTELAEVYEEWRKGNDPRYNYLQNGKPEGIPSELADVLIRVADLCGYYGINLQQEVINKMAYNASRSYMHGKRS